MVYRICILVIGLLPCSPAVAQVNSVVYNSVRDSIIARFNRNDFKGIYQLADTAFSNHISEDRLVSYLKSNRNSGNIISVVSQEETKGGISYHLQFEIRDMLLFLKVTPDRRFNSFGLSNVPITLSAVAPQVQSNNPLKTDMDRAVDSLVRDYFRDPRATGLSIGLIKAGKVSMYQYGETQKGSGHLPTSQTIYEIGSITKTFTATLLGKAVLDGKVALSDDIRRYLPGEFPNLSYADHSITLQDLANHTSRLPAMPTNIGDQRGYNPLMPEANYDSVLCYQALRSIKLDTVPGYKFMYSNWGMALLGHILENVYHQSYAQLLRQYITGPLGMVHTTYQLVNEDKRQLATPYSENGRPILFQDEGLFGPAGDIHADLVDMVRYMLAQLAEKDQAILLTHQPTRNGTGLGWGVRQVDNYRDIQHNGSTPGFTSHLSAFPELNSGCVLLANNKAAMGKLIVRLQTLVKQKISR